MTAIEEQARSIFLTAVERGPDQWPAFLAEACGAHAELRARVEQLLHGHQALGSIHRGGADAPAATTDEPLREVASQVIGPYKLIEQIGEGGMGTVWMAQQTEPVKRLVALKLIKAGMDSKQVIARFEAERQALALMDHANIARVLDAGATSAGRPYFVMDLVKGVPITRYCDEHQLTPRQRLELFIPVCQAVQHAHHKGIIHRDLKPSNVLVALYDGKPVPKVIDFGVAKAAGQPLTDKTLVTGFGNIVGTLEYMSPEQAEINQLDIDTRSDIYSLGVLLYELLTGGPPFSRRQLEKAGLLEMLRVIREQEPSKPSTKLSTAEGLPTLAANRGTEPAKLTKLVRGELDWIVMKALDKDRNRRYETANGFALDVQRYLADEPVQACPPSVGYRLRKFALRNKGPVIAAAVVVGTLIAGIVGTTIGMLRADIARKDQVEQRKLVEQERDAKEVARKQAVANLKTARLAVDRMLTRVSEEELFNQPHFEQVRKRLLEDALEFYRGFLQEHAEDPGIQRETALAYGRFGRICYLLGKYPEAEKNLKQAVSALDALPEEFRRSPEAQLGIIEAHTNLGQLVGWVAGRKEGRAQSILAFRTALRHAEALAERFPEVRRYRALVVNGCLGIVNADITAPDAKGLCQRAVTLAEGPGGDLNSLASALNYSSLLLPERDPAALATARRAVSIFEKLVQKQPGSPGRRAQLGWALKRLAIVLQGTGQTADADTAIQRSIAEFARTAADYPGMPAYRFAETQALLTRAGWLQSANRKAAAEEVYRQVLAILRELANTRAVPANNLNPSLMVSLRQLIAIQHESGRGEESAALWNELSRILQHPGADGAPEILAEGTRAEVRLKMANQWAKDGRQAEAEQAIEELMADLNRLEVASSGKPETRADVALVQYRLGVQLFGAGRDKEAQVLLPRAIALHEGLTADSPATVEYWQRLASCQVRMGLIAQKSNRLADAEKWFRARVEVNKRLVDESPTNGEFADRLASDHFRLAGLLADLNRAEEAAQDYAQAVHYYERASQLGPRPHDSAFAAAASRCNRAGHLVTFGKHAEAETEFRASLRAYEALPEDRKVQPGYKVNVAITSNQLAWLLAANAGDKAKNAHEAVRLAERAVELAPNAGPFWNTLGAAHYRANDHKAALAALEKSMELRKGGDGFDWFFLAMTHSQLGEKEKARELYHRAVQWVEKNQPKNPELARLQAETTTTLGIKKEEK